MRRPTFLPIWGPDGAPVPVVPFASMTHHTPHQKGIIKRFYEHRDTIALQKLGEIISNLYIETNEKKITTAWRAAEKHLLACGVTAHEAGNVVKDRDLGALAKIAQRLF